MSDSVRQASDRLTVPPSWGLDDPPPSPLGLFADWMDRLAGAGVVGARPVTLSTANEKGVVSARTVILKSFDERVLVFESETYSRKGVELAMNPRAAMTFYFGEVHRQICVTGEAAPLGDAVSDAHWRRRGRANQAATVASTEGEALGSVADELAMQDRADAIVDAPGPIDRPATYLAYGLVPLTVEFWEGSEDRLHRRVFYERRSTGAPWSWRRIQP